VDLYVVEDRDLAGWLDFADAGTVLTDLSDGVESVVSGSGGKIFTAIWTPGSGNVGDYDVVLDENHNGILDGNDVVDNEFEVGFSVNVPEFTTIAMPVGAILGLLFFFNHRKRKKE
jgi:hypothetical protein